VPPRQVVNLIRIEGAETLYHQCLHNIVQIKPECEKWGMPLMIEPLMYISFSFVL
jgi:DhnA family fructose-bisphosphate aldolase class Ia